MTRHAPMTGVEPIMGGGELDTCAEMSVITHAEAFPPPRNVGDGQGEGETWSASRSHR